MDSPTIPGEKLALINPHRWAEISGGDKAFEIKLLAIYLEQTEGYLADLKKGLINYYAVLVAKLAHQIKGASANVGIEAIAEIARSLQANAKSHHIKVADGLIGELNQLNSLLQQLKNYVADLKLRNGSSAEYREHLGKISRWQTT